MSTGAFDDIENYVMCCTSSAFQRFCILKELLKRAQAEMQKEEARYTEVSQKATA